MLWWRASLPKAKASRLVFNMEYRRQLAGLEGAPDGPHREEEEGGEAYQVEVIHLLQPPGSNRLPLKN